MPPRALKEYGPGRKWVVTSAGSRRSKPKLVDDNPLPQLQGQRFPDRPGGPNDAGPSGSCKVVEPPVTSQDDSVSTDILDEDKFQQREAKVSV